MNSLTIRRPAADGEADGRFRRGVAKAASVHGLLLILIALIVMFSLLRPETFPTELTFRGLLDSNGVVVLLALGVMIPLATNQFDLSLGYVVALTNSLAIGFQIKSGMSWEVAAVLILCIGIVIGVINGLLVAYAQIDSFIATLGSGTVLFGIANWYTHGAQISGPLSTSFESLRGLWFGVPRLAYFVLAVAIVLWLMFEYLPSGRFFYAVGSNRRAAELSGIDVRRRIVIAFALSALIASAAGILIASQLGVGQAGTGPDYLLPVFAAALLGSTSVRPGRVNVWGTVIAALVLAVAVVGMQQLGAAFYVSYLFNGGILVIAVGASGWVGRRRSSARRSEALRHATADDAPAENGSVPALAPDAVSATVSGPAAASGADPESEERT
ncbi:MAG TPA: ABC transporter permease [Solirubrobacterales bacterium]|nr:ABC transporter permease [Solirubrobacterales bacterium]